MKTRYLLLLCLLASALCAAKAAVITVTTASASPVSGQTNFFQAIQMLHDGDTIGFHIPGTNGQVFYLITPKGGYPFITNNNVTIDGYTQPGSAPNANPIHAPNNAKIKICLDSRNGEATDMGNYTNFIDPTIVGGDLKPGFGHDEWGIIPIFRGTNAHIRGLAILSSPQGSDGNATIKSISVACDYVGTASGWHVDGCWIGVDPADGQVKYLADGTPASPGIGFATYSHRQGASTNVYANFGTFGVSKNATNPPAEFNVLVTGYGVDLQGWGHRFSGNFANVLPDGMHNVDWSKLNGGNQEGDGDFECGGSGVGGLTVGTDGDGVNDAQEANLFGGSLDPHWTHVYLYSSPKTNIVVAGNWFGLAVDGKTRFANGARVLHTLGSQGDARVGSDFDGVSDALEANLVYNDYPFAQAVPSPAGSPPPKLFDLDVGSRLSLRGNVLVGNTLVPYTYADGTGGLLESYTNYEAAYMLTTNQTITPVLATNSVYPRLVGSCAPGNPPYTNIIIDVYQLDPEGWTNGQLFTLPELANPDGTYEGFPQGKKYLGSFVDNGPLDSDPAVGKFNLDLSRLDVGPGPLTVTANYSADKPGVHNGRVHTSDFSMPAVLAPGGTASVGLTNIVPDVLLWYDGAKNLYTNGPVDPAAQTANLNNWEPYTSVLGDATFLIAATTFADDQTQPPGADITASPPFQRFAVTFQPAAGGPAKIGEEFFTDAGAPYRGVINYSRENGNPDRVAGDKRLGATNFITAAETSAGQVPGFMSDSRWSSNLIYQADNRYVTVQTFSLDPVSLTQVPLHKAFDAVYGNYVDASTAPSSQPEVSRTGGAPTALDNGNFVVMIDDKSGFTASGQVATFAIITPQGSVVRINTLVDPRDIWDNITAYHGGFAVRVHNLLYFYDDTGALQHTNDINASSGLSFGVGREDSSRIASDIRSDYVYLAGQSPESGKNDPVQVAIWDARTGQFVASAQVTDTDPTAQIVGRVVIAVDALNRFCVAYDLRPNDNFGASQVAARVMKFDGAAIAYLTHSFFPFVNFDPTGGSGLTTTTPNVSMTTRQILIAAKGAVNGNDNPAAGPNTAAQTTLYTVISHPDPQPTPGATPFTITATALSGNNNLTIAWSGGTPPFLIQMKNSLSAANWTNVLKTAGQSATVPRTGQAGFFRISDHADNATVP